MMQLTCPLCGPRAENEFHCGGTTGIARPPLSCSDETWGSYLYFRDNPKGDHAERWRHSFGCGLWFNLLRDTVTHEVKATYGITAPCPEVPTQGRVSEPLASRPAADGPLPPAPGPG